MKKLFMISGMPHSATRLMFDLLSSTKNFSVPENGMLNTVRELPVLHAYLTSLTKITKFSKNIDIDQNDLSMIFLSYISTCDGDDNILIKMPYYPVVYYEKFKEAAHSIGYSINLIVVDREEEKIFKSYCGRNEDIKYSEPNELLSQLGRLPLDYKLEAISFNSFEQVFKLQFTSFKNSLSLVPSDFLVFKVTDLSEIESALSEWGIIGDIDFTLVNERRLLNNKIAYVKSIVNKIERKILQYKVRSY